jgi:hypothetical protein
MNMFSSTTRASPADERTAFIKIAFSLDFSLGKFFDALHSTSAFKRVLTTSQARPRFAAGDFGVCAINHLPTVRDG